MIYIDRASKTPYYLQIYKQLLDQILSGQLPAGHLLPGSRALATHLGVGRNTVDNAYAQLSTEGYIHAEAGRGFRVQRLPEFLLDKAGPTAPSPIPEAKEPPIRYDLFYGNLANQDFPFFQWKKEMIAVLSDESNRQINDYPGHKGDDLLRAQLAEYLFETRGVSCTPEQIVITSGLQGSLEILCKLLYPSDGIHADPG